MTVLEEPQCYGSKGMLGKSRDRPIFRVRVIIKPQTPRAVEGACRCPNGSQTRRQGTGLRESLSRIVSESVSFFEFRCRTLLDVVILVNARDCQNVLHLPSIIEGLLNDKRDLNMLD